MKKRKTLLASIAVALVAILCIGGTLAYFTDYAGDANNVFDVKGDGTEESIFNAVLSEPLWLENADHYIAPGAAFDKNPTITLDKDAYELGAYVAFKVNVTGTGTLTEAEVEGLFSLAGAAVTVDATPIEGGGFTFTVYPAQKLDATDPDVVLFDKVTFPADLSPADLITLGDFQIDVYGYAISAEGFANAAAAQADLAAYIATNPAA